MAETKKVPPFNPEIKGKEKDESGEEEEPLKKEIPPKIKDEEEEEEEKDEELEEDKIPHRKSALGFIIGRQKETIEKLREKKKEEEITDEEEELTPEAERAVDKAISKKVDPLLGNLAKQSDEDELQDLFSQEPESEKYEKRIRSYMNNPHYKGVPPSVIFHHLAFAKAETTGAQRKTTADKETELNKGGGRTLRPKAKETGNLPSKEEMEDMTDEEIEALQHKARTGEFLEKE